MERFTYTNERCSRKDESGPLIGVDIDGVLADFNEAFLTRLNNLNGTSWTKDDVTAYDYQDCIGISREQVYAIFEEMTTDGSYALLEPMDGLHLLEQLPGRVRLITARFDSCSKDTLAWLEKHNVIRHEDVTFIKGAKSVMGPFDYFIEDAPKNAIDLSAVTRQVFLIDHPYNRNIELPENVMRVSNWHQVVAHIQSEESFAKNDAREWD